jgi:hypothetical protein
MRNHLFKCAKDIVRYPEEHWPLDKGNDEILEGLTRQVQRKDKLTRHHAMQILAAARDS